MKTYFFFCPLCILQVETPTVEQLERARYDHVKAEHPDRLVEVGQLLAPVDLIEGHLHYGDEEIAWVACRLCGEREEIPVAPTLYPTYAEAEAAVDAVAAVFGRTHAERHLEALIAAEPAPPENPFD